MAARHPVTAGRSPAVEQQRHIALPTGRVSVQRGGGADAAVAGGPVLVFLHEALGCHGMWRQVPGALSAATGLPWLSYDRLGHGRSDPLGGPRRADYLDVEAEEVLPAVLEACGVGDPILIGHSDGGTIALLYAARHPVRALVTVAAHVFVEEITLTGIRDAVEAWRTTDLPDRLARHHGGKTQALFSAWSDTWLSEAFRDWNIEPRLGAVTAPCLVIQGEGDEYGTGRQVEAIADGVRGPAQAMIVPGCGHIPHLQAPDRVLPAIAAFVMNHLD